MRSLIILLLLLLLAGGSLAREAPPASADPALERRVAALSAELRCLVCQNQSLADSHADLAIDLRNQVREQMRAGRSDDEIRAWLTQRYGDFVLYRPPVKASTWGLWFGPFLLLAVGGLVLLAFLRSRARRAGGDVPTVEELARARELLQTPAENPNK